MPTIDLSSLHELESWIATRLTFSEFGDVETKRITGYIIADLILAVLLGIWILLLWFENFDQAYVLRNNMVLHLGIYDILLLVFFSAYLILRGAKTNKEANEHRILLSRLRIHNHFEDAKILTMENILDDEDNDQLAAERKERDYLLDSGISLFKTISEVNPSKFLGSKSTESLAVSILTITITGFGILIRDVFINN